MQSVVVDYLTIGTTFSGRPGIFTVLGGFFSLTNKVSSTVCPSGHYGAHKWWFLSWNMVVLAFHHVL